MAAHAADLTSAINPAAVFYSLRALLVMIYIIQTSKAVKCHYGVQANRNKILYHEINI